MTPDVMSEQAWDERYRRGDAGGWSGAPNAVLVQEVEQLTPGRALDVGCGEGGDALWLASRGWTVIGADLSGVVLERAAVRAQGRGLQVAWEHRDVLTWSPPTTTYELASACFLHPSGDNRPAVHARLAAAVAPGGHLLLVAHAPSHAATLTGTPFEGLPLFATPEQVVADLDLDAFDVRVAEVRSRASAGHGGHGGGVVEDVVVHAVRRVPA
ncbi:MAG: Methyltransferase type 11 [Frankiales bacterium]|nr:Methyltransferase type 11 [Frankiales bacterium]